jgi:hypothetical protein
LFCAVALGKKQNQHIINKLVLYSKLCKSIFFKLQYLN